MTRFQLFTWLTLMGLLLAAELRPIEAATDDDQDDEVEEPATGSSSPARVTSCDDLECGNADCNVDSKGRAFCDCNSIVCTKEFKQVCGSNGKTYNNACELKVDQCKQPESNITKVSDMACESGPRSGSSSNSGEITCKQICDPNFVCRPKNSQRCRKASIIKCGCPLKPVPGNNNNDDDNDDGDSSNDDSDDDDKDTDDDEVPSGSGSGTGSGRPVTCDDICNPNFKCEPKNSKRCIDGSRLRCLWCPPQKQQQQPITCSDICASNGRFNCQPANSERCRRANNLRCKCNSNSQPSSSITCREICQPGFVCRPQNSARCQQAAIMRCDCTVFRQPRGTPSRECNSFCPQIVDYVCGTDGVTYTNSCYLNIAACEQRRNIRVAYKTKCRQGMVPIPQCNF